MNACNLKFQMWKCFIFYECVCRGKGADMERSFGWLLDYRTGQEALQMQHREKEQSMSELRPSVKRKCCVWGRPGLNYVQPISWGFVQLCYSTGIPAHLCESICCLTCYTDHLQTYWKKHAHEYQYQAEENCRLQSIYWLLLEFWVLIVRSYSLLYYSCKHRGV